MNLICSSGTQQRVNYESRRHFWMNFDKVPLKRSAYARTDAPSGAFCPSTVVRGNISPSLPICENNSQEEREISFRNIINGKNTWLYGWLSNQVPWIQTCRKHWPAGPKFWTPFRSVVRFRAEWNLWPAFISRARASQRRIHYHIKSVNIYGNVGHSVGSKSSHKPSLHSETWGDRTFLAETSHCPLAKWFLVPPVHMHAEVRKRIEKGHHWNSSSRNTRDTKMGGPIRDVFL